MRAVTISVMGLMVMVSTYSLAYADRSSIEPEFAADMEFGQSADIVDACYGLAIHTSPDAKAAPAKCLTITHDGYFDENALVACERQGNYSTVDAELKCLSDIKNMHYGAELATSCLNQDPFGKNPAAIMKCLLPYGVSALETSTPQCQIAIAKSMLQQSLDRLQMASGGQGSESSTNVAIAQAAQKLQGLLVEAEQGKCINSTNDLSSMNQMTADIRNLEGQEKQAGLVADLENSATKIEDLSSEFLNSAR